MSESKDLSLNLRDFLPDLNNDLIFEDLNGDVEIYRDTWGIPHIKTKDEFLKTYKIEYPVLYGSAKQISKISSDYGGIRALPTSIIIDRKGEIKRIYPTAILKDYTPSIYSSFIYDIETALNNKVDTETQKK